MDLEIEQLRKNHKEYLTKFKQISFPDGSIYKGSLDKENKKIGYG